MKKILLTLACFLSTSLLQSHGATRDQLDDIDPQEIRITLEIGKNENVHPDAWQDLKECVLKLFNPTIESAESLEQWLTLFNIVVRKVALTSAQAKGIRGSLNIRFIT